jgi:hypothetical protein
MEGALALPVQGNLSLQSKVYQRRLHVACMPDNRTRQLPSGVGPSSVCEVTGFRGQPAAGEELYVVDSERYAVDTESCIIC